ncbi:MAG: diphthamide synthesis protein [Nanoarchaeota archaeon]
MDYLFIEGKYNEKFNLKNLDVKILPKRLALFTTIQYIDYLDEIKEELKKQGIDGILINTNQKYKSQIVGCSINNYEKYDIDGILFIGDGNFHPIALSLKNNLPIFILNLYNKKILKLDESKIKEIQKQKKIALTKFYSSKNISIIVSIKHGQYNLDIIERIKKKFPNKNYYILLFDNIEFNQLENFNFTDCFINTACPRINYDDFNKFFKPVVYANDLL